jgi:SAM-dependent methyltransferase
MIPTEGAKRAYYEQPGMKQAVAMRYWKQIPDARRVLDVGCGWADIGRYKPPSVEVHGVDSDPGAVGRALPYESARCVDLELGALPYEDGYFDAVIAKDILEHLIRPEATVQEMYRVLRPGGRLLVSVVAASSRRVWDDYTHVRGFTPRSARLLLEDVGFTVDRVSAMGGVPLSSRLGFLGAVPTLLRLPIARSLWLSSWELSAFR